MEDELGEKNNDRVCHIEAKNIQLFNKRNLLQIF